MSKTTKSNPTTTDTTPENGGWEAEAAAIHEEAVTGDANVTGADSTDEAKVRVADTALRSIDSYAAAEDLLRSLGMEIEDAEDVMGTGFSVLDNKALLEGVPFIVLAYDFHQGSFKRNGEPAYFASMVIVTADGKKYIVNDGGSGIYQQLEEHSVRAKKRGGLRVKGGLRVSRYEHPVYGDAETFYLNLS